MKNPFIGLLVILLLFAVGCQASPPIDDSSEFETVVFEHTGEVVKAASPSFAVGNCSKVFVGCYDMQDLLDFLSYWDQELTTDPETPDLIPAVQNYYQHTPDIVSADNLTMVNGLRIQNVDGTFNYDTSAFVFNWYLNDQFAYTGFNLPYSMVAEVLECDGVIEIGMHVQYSGHNYSREVPAFINFDDLSACGGIDICPTCVFYDFYPSCQWGFLSDGGWRFDRNNDHWISTDDLTYFGGQYGNCL